MADNTDRKKPNNFILLAYIAFCIAVFLITAASYFYQLNDKLGIPPLTAPPLALPAARPNPPKGFWDVIFSNPLLIALASGGFGVFVADRFKVIEERLAETDRRSIAQAGQADRLIKEMTETSREQIAGSLQRLQSKIDSLEENYPWLLPIQELPEVINVRSPSAVLETTAILLEKKNFSACYEWLSSASHDNELNGSAFDFLMLGLLADAILGDALIADGFFRKAERASKVGRAERAYLIYYYLVKQNYDRAAEKIYNSESEISKSPYLSLWERILFNYRRGNYNVSAEMLAIFGLYYALSADTIGLTRWMPRIRRHASKSATDRAGHLLSALSSGDALEELSSEYMPSGFALVATAHEIKTKLGIHTEYNEEFDYLITMINKFGSSRAFTRAISAGISGTLNNWKQK